MFTKKAFIMLLLFVMFCCLSALEITIWITWQELEVSYPRIDHNDLFMYDYTIRDVGIDFYLVEIDGKVYLIVLEQ